MQINILENYLFSKMTLWQRWLDSVIVEITFKKQNKNKQYIIYYA